MYNINLVGNRGFKKIMVIRKLKKLIFRVIYYIFIYLIFKCNDWL